MLKVKLSTSLGSDGHKRDMVLVGLDIFGVVRSGHVEMVGASESTLKFGRLWEDSRHVVWS